MLWTDEVYVYAGIPGVRELRFTKQEFIRAVNEAKKENCTLCNPRTTEVLVPRTSLIRMREG